MKVDWKKKLSSRKFWIALIGLITALGALFGMENGTTEQIVTVIMSFGTLIAYILSEGFVDANRN